MLDIGMASDRSHRHVLHTSVACPARARSLVSANLRHLLPRLVGSEAEPLLRLLLPAPDGAGHGGGGIGLALGKDLLRPQAQTSAEHWRDAREIEHTIGTQPNGSMPGTRTWPLPKWLTWMVVPQLRNRTRRRAAIACFAGLLVPVGYSVKDASVATTPRTRLIESHSLLATKRATAAAFDISSSEDTVEATLLWGVNKVLSKGDEPDSSPDAGRPWQVNLVRNSSFIGRLEFSSSFVFDEATQAHVAAACDELRRQPWVQLDADTATQGFGGRVGCFVDEFRAWLSNRSQGALPDFGTSYPVPNEKKPALALATFVASDEGVLWQPYVGSVGSQDYIRFVSISAKLKLRSSATRSEARESASMVLNMTDRINAAAPASAGPAIASTEEVWAWMRAQAALPSEAMGGSARTASVCLVVLLLISGSLPLTALTMIAVTFATATMLGLLVASGWALGSVEAVLACVTPALLTPPAALIIRAYVRASRPSGPRLAVESRVERAVRAFEQASIPITSGWVAMAVALTPMLLCQLMTEFKVAAALCFAAACVSAWIGVFLPLLLAEIGPEAAGRGLPLWGSLPWLLLPLLDPAGAFRRRRDAVHYRVVLCTQAETTGEASAALQRDPPASGQKRTHRSAGSIRMVVDSRQQSNGSYGKSQCQDERQPWRQSCGAPRKLKGGRRGNLLRHEQRIRSSSKVDVVLKLEFL